MYDKKHIQMVAKDFENVRVKNAAMAGSIKLSRLQHRFSALIPLLLQSNTVSFGGEVDIHLKFLISQ